MTCFSRQSGCTRLRLDTFRASPYPDGDCCKATPLISTIRQRLDKFGSFLFYGGRRDIAFFERTLTAAKFFDILKKGENYGEIQYRD